MRGSLPPSRIALALALVTATLSSSCTDAQLYHLTEVPSLPNKVAFTGSVCTDNPAERSFPLRVVYLVDASADLPPELTPEEVSLLGAQRVQSVRDSITVTRGQGTAFAIVRFGGTSSLAPEGGFSDNSVLVSEGAGALSIPMAGAGEGQRRTLQALQIASSLITGDVLSTAKGPRSRTKYVVVLVQAGRADDALLNAQANPAAGCDNACVLSRRVEELRKTVLEAGAADFQLHAVDVTPAVTTDPARLDPAQDELVRMAFAGAGEYRPVCRVNDDGTRSPPGCGPHSLSLLGVDIESARNVFVKKSFIVANLNARHTNEGIVPDSDGDGLPDHLEDLDGDGEVRPPMCADRSVCASDADCAGIGNGRCNPGETDPRRRDTDGDGIGDKVEQLLSTVGLNPLAQDAPPQCAQVVNPATTDSDGDGLTDCEEILLGLDPTLFDTDADGTPDLLEFLAGTNFLVADSLHDLDFDGVSNEQELRAHSDPRSSDALSRAELSYLYREVDLGIREHRYASQPRDLSGAVVVQEVSADSGIGNGVLVYLPAGDGEPAHLAWRDPAENAVGDAVPIDGDGVYVLHSACSSSLPEKDCSALEKSLTVFVTAALLPPFPVDANLRVAIAERHCTDFRVRNVTLVETLAADGRAAGNNDVRIFFGQVPQDTPEAYGIFRVAQYNYRFLAPDFKDPNVADQPVDSFRFVLFGDR